MFRLKLDADVVESRVESNILEISLVSWAEEILSPPRLVQEVSSD